MNDLWVIASGAGLHDGLNPCIFMACGVLITLGCSRVLFALVYALGVAVFNFGPGQFLILRKEFIFTAKWVYLFLGIWAFVSGVFLLKEWALLRFGKLQEQPAAGAAGGRALGVVAVSLAVVLSAMSTLAPVNNYIVLLANEALLKGQWQEIMPLLAGYVFFSMFPLWLVWAFINIKNVRPPLFKIVCASVFFTASSCAILIFK